MCVGGGGGEEAICVLEWQARTDEQQAVLVWQRGGGVRRS